MLRIRTGKTELCFERDIIGRSSLQTLLDRILWRFDEVIDELQFVIVSRILNREYFLENLEQTLVLPVFRCCFKLEKVLERLQLHLKKIRVFKNF